ncbi:uncharacterized protein PFL1_03130 [Pseudozyma flocculosa PF-1]|uniref:Related to Phosducin n=2 Tax=Pseudozyma flocculosa TaxID=84751 RepID=A0A5C3F054_9BASI|nr:uncharacterized protein PFL1_03130 [Pseudozyma flocculosa PF-1]EPQ29375.1 hypothetical protein PFL1_03130 [Pseudozyma flocculosa PF-1]SPO37894.1 related to Phosducin [Pseudozyma flocculosa]
MSSTDPLETAILQGVDAPDRAADADDRGPQARAAYNHERHSSPPNTDDELGSDLPSDDDDDDAGGPGGRPSRTEPSRLSSQIGAANTGPKGVINDHKMQALQARAERAERVHQTNAQMEKMSFQTETWDQQQARERSEAKLRRQRENADSDDDGAEGEGAGVSAAAIADLRAKEKRREQRIAELKNQGRQSKRFSFQTALGGGGVGGQAQAGAGPGAGSDRWFGHLREVDERGYVAAIDKEDRTTPVVIHIYSRGVEACAVLTSALSSLARTYPRTKFLQVQASAIGFGGARPRHDDGTIDEDDEEDEGGDARARQDRAADVLPTLLVYRGGELVANLVRVDLEEAWRGGTEPAIRDLLSGYDALVTADGRPGRRNAYGSSDDESDS